ncbi:hypothetical protein [Akkermansia sp.]|uniref:hypothetical protein n=1 Tax=Akkermansia sp. TaxID=1872421 RepID=UPI0025C51F76|nr:hypothetical protein [Akkermansia sp.]
MLKYINTFLLAILTITAIVIAVSMVNHNATRSEMVDYEYQGLSLPLSSEGDFYKPSLDRQLQDGWQIYSVLSVNNLWSSITRANTAQGIMFILRRPKH